MSDRKLHWRCFHCGEGFTKAQERWAREHFGADQDSLPVCQMRLPGEHHLLTILRKQESELNAYRAEETDLWRSLYAMSADHAAALRREEERGYEKGVADGRAALGLTETLKAAGLGAALPPGYHYGRDAMEQVELGKRIATAAILAALPVCANHSDRASRTNLDGEQLCQECADAWVRGEGENAAWLEAEGRDGEAR